ncbi:gamma-glutamyltransferase [Thermogemmatispora sp.]|uniref:gamma-glutamyltransferase n=1 Tax=Thermogemmatispora sp. TaxID=1968838 RepID=UPI0035E42DD0
MLSDQPVFGSHAMVSCAHYLATRAGLQVLERGGNAVDAAVAANAAMTVVYPPTCSAGGDIFMLIWEARSRRLHALNGSGRAPRALTAEYFAAHSLREIPAIGPLSITVPGAVDGWFEALERFGRLPVEEVFAPAIAYAEEGFPVSPKLASWLERAAETVLRRWEATARVFLPGGRPPSCGDILRQPDLARTYRLLAREGREAFYRGPLARTIVDYVQRCGGVLSLEDLQAHRSDWVTPLSTSYRGYEVFEFPPNSQGLTVLEMLNILEGYDLQALGYQSPETLHLMIEAKKLAFADRDRYLSDPAFVEIPVERLLSKDYAEQLRARINPQRAASQVTSASEPERNGDTMYLCVVDEEGNAVSLIQSLFYSWGSGIVAGESGVLLHNRGSYFSLNPRHVNYLQPGKRTMHTLTPALVLRSGEPFLVLGTMGADAQPQIHVQLLTAIIDFGLNVQQALNAPRWRSGRLLQQGGRRQLLQGQQGAHPAEERATSEVVALEQRFPNAVALGLEMLGHQVAIWGPWEDDMGHAQAIMITPATRVLQGGADPRCDGLALGW